MARVTLVLENGQQIGDLPRPAEDILARAEAYARSRGLAKVSHFPAAIRQEIEEAGWRVSDAALAGAMVGFNAVRRGDRIDCVLVHVTAGDGVGRASSQSAKGADMSGKTVGGLRFFESERTYPDRDARVWYDRLIGLDEHKQQLVLELELLLFPERIAAWSRKHHGRELIACQIMSSRAPLVLLEGDVGCGKTVLAETVGDVLAERTNGKVHLLKINSQVRGTGMVGEMTELIVQAFNQVESRADALRGEPVLLLIDEADALAAKRVDQHMHHEDKAGLNTLLQRLDSLRHGRRRIAVMFITNRPDALDPAIRRRAALRLSFGRPGDQARAEMMRRLLPELPLDAKRVKDLVALTGHDAVKKYGTTFTASDVTDRLIPAALRDAYAEERPVTVEDLIRHARNIEPTPAMLDGE